MTAFNMTVVKKGAKSVAAGTGKLLDLMQRASEKLEPLTRVPFIGDTVSDVKDIIAMVNDYYHGRYKKLPVTVLIGCAGIAAYLLSPLDLIPDNIPILGFVDDVFIINLIMEFCVDKELEKYRAWRAPKISE